MKEIHYPISIGLLLNGLLNFFGIRPEPGPEYRVIRHDDDIQIRDYPEFVIAKTYQDGHWHQASHNNFATLSDYIFGNNFGQHKLEMTSPVFQAPDNSKGNFTEDDGWHMGLIMPDGYQKYNLPMPKGFNVRFETIPAQRIAAIRYSGNTNPYVMQMQADKLTQWLKKHRQYKIAGTPRSAQYDPPFTIPSRKRNEIHIPLRGWSSARKKFFNIF